MGCWVCGGGNTGSRSHIRHILLNATSLILVVKMPRLPPTHRCVYISSCPGRIILTLSALTFCTNYTLEIEQTGFKEKFGLWFHVISINTFKNWNDILLVNIYTLSSKEEGGFRKRRSHQATKTTKENHPQGQVRSRHWRHQLFSLSSFIPCLQINPSFNHI